MWPPRSLAITQRARVRRAGEDEADALVAFAEALAAAGVDAVQVRERDWPDGPLLAVVRRICDAVRGTECRVLVNERAHVAWAAGASGVHVRRTGVPAVRLRHVQPAGQLIGRSVHLDDAPGVVEGTDYVLFGTVFPSGSKAPDAPVAGVDGLAGWVRRAGSTPVLAVGGIDVARCAAVRAAGASGVAGIDLFVAARAAGGAALHDTVAAIHAVFRDGERAQ